MITIVIPCLNEKKNIKLIKKTYLSLIEAIILLLMVNREIIQEQSIVKKNLTIQ